MKRTSIAVIMTAVFVLIAALAAPAQTINCSGVPAWAANTAYTTNALVTYNNAEYKCAQGHTSQPGWQPPNVPALWHLVGSCGSFTPTPTATATAKPTATITATPTATAKPTATATATPITGHCWAPWSATTTYFGGAQVSYNNVNYQAAYWTVNQVPVSNSGPAGSGKPWIPEGTCSGATPTPTATTTPTATATPTAKPTPTITATPTATPKPGLILAGYFEEWGIYTNYNVKNLQTSGVADKMTHVIYAFGNVANNACVIADAFADFQKIYDNTISVNGLDDPGTPGAPHGSFYQLMLLKQLHPNLKVTMALGGASAPDAAAFSAAASTAAGRTALVSSCINMFIDGNVGNDFGGNPVNVAGLFDGIDIDWEFPSASDTQNFTLLMQEFRKQLDAAGAANGHHYLLTMEGAPGAFNFSNMNLGPVSTVLDFINVDGFDFHGSWETSANHASSLYDSAQDPAASFKYDVDDTLTAYIQAGVPASKIVMGIPMYGRGWSGVPSTNNGLYQSSTGLPPAPANDALAAAGLASYDSLQAMTGFTLYYDSTRATQWMYNPSSQTFYTFDDALTIGVKMNYVKARGLGGAWVWAFRFNADGTLVKDIAADLGL